MKNKKQKNQPSADQELRRLGVLIKRLDSNVDKLLKKMGEKGLY